jgi:thiosulfate/3-mercaptopyruvate sulfurtransferase
MEPLVSTDWLESHLGDADLRIIDATVDIDVASGRIDSGRSRWEAGHIPGAMFADLLVDLSEPDDRLAFVKPSPQRFAAAMARLGVGDGVRVVVYDARESMWATRLWWMLRSFGFDDAAVLDGGWVAWVAEGRPVTTETSEPAPAVFTPREQPDRFVNKDQVLASLGDAAVCIVDALSRREFTGELAFYGRPGHLPGAINVPARRLLERDSQRYRSLDDLRELLAPALAARQVITYCGGGVAATSDAFALHLNGCDQVAVYDGSMGEWAPDPTLPLVTGEASDDS